MRLNLKYCKVNRELSFRLVVIFCHSGFEVNFQISYGEYRTVIRRGGNFLSIIRVLRLYFIYSKVNRELSFGGEVLF